MAEPKATPTPEKSESAVVESIDITERDIVFDCPKCHTELVVDKEGAGIRVPCSQCGTMVTVPPYTGPSQRASGSGVSPNAPVPAEQLQVPDFEEKSDDELKERLGHLERLHQENKSQRMEVTSYINQNTIQLHRYQLRLQKLQTRQKDLEAELTALQSELRKRLEP